ncbi:MAG: EAL domain-containing protein [Campylobacteraceae bacterium]|nr:EAL domain-containing protein [Campylobacteraceae bacterium]
MSIVTKATLVVMIVTTVLVVAFTSMKALDEYRHLDSKLELQQRYASLIYKVIMKDIGSELEAKANIVVGSDKIKEAFAKGDRQKLYELTKPFYEEYKDHFKLMAFIGKDNVHFLRMQEPQKFGDNLSAKRPIIAEINTQHKPIYSFEPTLYGLSFVYLAPMFYNGEYIGFFHIGVDAKTLQNRLDDYLNAKTAILFDSAAMEEFEKREDKHKIGNFSLITYNDPFFEKIPMDFNFSKPSLDIDNKIMNLSEYNITDYKGRLVAKMLFALNITSDIEQTRSSIFKAVFFSLPVLIGIFAVLRYAFGVLMDRIAKNEADLIERLYFDSITGLPNRFSLKEDLDEMDKPFVVLIDIDSFKEINDLYGFAVGDFVLAALAKKIKEKLPKRLKLYKLSADEFAIVGNEAGKYQSEDKMEKLVASFAKEPIYYQDNKILISLTAGASFDKDGILEHADMALKEAKKKRILYLVYDRQMEIAKEYENNIKWSAKLREAIAEDRIATYYQPIVDTKSGKIEKYEALVRLIEPSGTAISPLFFLEISKKAKLYHSITKSVISSSFKKFENSKYAVSINISTEDILSLEIKEFILKKLTQASGKCKIIFELLESDGIENYEEVSHFISEVKKFGAEVAVDDFGTGYSNFERILKLNVDYLKIDGTLIRNINEDKNSEVIVETIVGFAKKLGIKTVAEFVHSKEVLDKVKEMGIDYAQGFYLSEPKEEPLEKVYLP